MERDATGFPRTARLTRPNEYSHVLKEAAVRRRFGPVRLMATKSSSEGARVGLIVAKRIWRRAVDRNRVKRTIRETFRHARGILPSVDVVVQVVDRATDAEIRDALARGFAFLDKSFPVDR